MMNEEMEEGGCGRCRLEEDAKILLEAIEHPERFCPICHKRVGVCKHTGGRSR